MNKKYIIYCTICTANDKIYIGQHVVSDDPYKFDGYLGCGVEINKPSSYEKSKTVFQRAVQKYGLKCFKRYVLCVVDTQEEANLIEGLLVNSSFLARKDVYNTILGGINQLAGTNAKPCYQYDSAGRFIQEYPSVAEAARDTNILASVIHKAIIGQWKCRNYYWSRSKLNMFPIHQTRYDGNKVYEYTATGEYVTEYVSYMQAAKANGVADTYLREAVLCGIMVNNKYFSLEKSNQFSDAKLKQIRTLPVFVYHADGTFYKKIANIEEVRKELKARNDLFRYIRLGKLYDNKWQFSYEQLEKMPDKSMHKPRSRKVAQYDMNDNFIQEFESGRAARKAIGSGVSHCLNKDWKHYKGFKFKYCDEVKDIV